jgi:hypothetical protein
MGVCSEGKKRVETIFLRRNSEKSQQPKSGCAQTKKGPSIHQAANNSGL